MFRSARRVLSLWLPNWPTDRLRRREPSLAAAPFVTVATTGNRRVVLAVDAAAALDGIAPGLTLADARARLPGLRAIEADSAGDAAALAALADWCTRFTPWASVADESGIWLDVTGAVPLFASEAVLAEELLERLAAAGFAGRAAIADTPGCAWAVARFATAAGPIIVPPGGARAALAGLPVASLRLPGEIVQDLRRLGLRKVDSLYPLPRAPLAPRFGEAVARRLDQALGLVEEPISPRAPILKRAERQGFAEPVSTAEGLAHFMRLLTGRLCQRLAEEGMGARRLELACYRVDAQVQRIAIGTSRPSHDRAHLARLLEPRIETIAPGFGIELMVLSAPEIEAQPAEQGGLLPARPDETDMAPLVDRLANRLGAANVLRLAALDSHLPERAMRLVPAFEPMPRVADWFTARPRPLRLVLPPDPVEVTALVPDDPPVRFRWRRIMHQVRHAEGPERIAAEWWRRIGLAAPDDDLRDYYRVEDEEGRRFWLYRDGLYRPDVAPRWFLHGLFPMKPDYAELQITSNFSFLEGGSHPKEMVAAAKALGHAAVAITDRNTLAGIVRAHVAAKQVDIRLVIGCRLDFRDRPSLLCFPTDLPAYSRLSQLLTLGKRRAPKGECWLDAADLASHAEGQILVLLPPEQPDEILLQWVRKDTQAFGKNLYLAASHLYRGDDAARLAWLDRAARECGTRLVATNDALYHVPARRSLQDVVTCIRLKCTIETAGRALAANAERHLKPADEICRLFSKFPHAVEAVSEIVARCNFNLDQLQYEYPSEVPEGRDPHDELIARVERGVQERYGEDPPEKVRKLVAHELKLIAERNYAPFFLTVHDIVSFAKRKKILCQGRGSAANSVVCYVLGITAVDPGKHDMLFERFISTARNEPPDIDVDFGHERREEVIQHIYKTYTRERTGIAATVICYRTRSAVREIGKVMGLSVDSVAALSRLVWGWSTASIDERQVREAGLDPGDPLLRRVLALADELNDFPRHLSQHVGGFVITKGPLADLVPICNAAMAERTNIEWDKDDLDAVGMLKVDVLGLGMLTCLDKAFALAEQHYGDKLELYTIPQDVPEVYEMIQRADTVGVFQIESRAQMSMLPRLKPKEFYDLVIEVAIVRPGPIQGDMVHPYLRRRNGEEKPEYPGELYSVLKKTLGVPLFQEQAMKIAIVGASFSPDEADGLRRAMATFKAPGKVEQYRSRFIDGMMTNGYEPEFAKRCFKQIEGFGTYGFPESHAVSFAFLAYDSAWLKWRYPDVFACALLNSLPMGFYEPAQIVRDAAEHGVEVRPVDINHSDWDCTLEDLPGAKALRLGLRLVKGLGEAAGETLMKLRGAGYGSVADLARRSGLKRDALKDLARADAFRSVGLDRRAALWAVKGLDDAATLPLFAGLAAPVAREETVALPKMALGEHVFEDYGSTGLSLKRHPVALLRAGLKRRRIRQCDVLREAKDGTWIEVAGLVLVRQRPGTASGVIFMTLEDETGIANIVIWNRIFETHRRIVMTSRMAAVRGRVQKEGIVVHVVAERIVDLSDELRQLDRPFALSHGRGDEAHRPGHDHRDLAQRSRDFH